MNRANAQARGKDPRKGGPDDRRWAGALAVAATIGIALLAANSMASCLFMAGKNTGVESVPQPIGWITQLLEVESWPTFESSEVRWVIWGLATVALIVPAVAFGRRRDATDASRPTFELLVLVCGSLALLVTVRAIFVAVPVVGLAWTWQMALGLVWMLAVYAWTVRLSVATIFARRASPWPACRP